MIDLGSGQPAPGGRPSTAPVLGFLPRSAALQEKAPQGADGAAGGDAPKSNADFRKMLLSKK
jgi:hypothetical protein